MTARAALHRYLTGQREAFVTAEADVPEGDSVHDLRVAARRIRAVLIAYRQQFDASRVRDLCDELQWAGRELSDLRDAEVLRESVEAALLEESADRLDDSSRQTIGGADDVTASPTDAIRQRLDAATTELEAEVADAMRSDRWATLRAKLDRFVDDPPWNDDPSSSDSGDSRADVQGSLAAQASRTLQRLRIRVERAADAPVSTRYVPLHEVRKAAKRMRYALEVIGLDEPAGQQLAVEVTAIQSAIGDYLDAVRAAEWAATITAEQPAGSAAALDLERLRARLDAEVVAQERRSNDAITALFTSRTLDFLAS
jgi:CHAD domain-containing protein